MARTYSTREAADATGISEAMIRFLARAGLVNAHRLGLGKRKRLRFDKSEVDRIRKAYQPAGTGCRYVAATEKNNC